MDKSFNKAISYIDMSNHNLPGVPLFRYEYYHKETTCRIFINNIQVAEIIGEDAIKIFEIANGEKKHKHFLTDFEVKLLAADCVGISIEDMENKGRSPKIVWARYLAFYYFREHKRYTQEHCGMLFKDPLDHASVLHGVNKIKNDNQTDWRYFSRHRFLRRVEKIHKKINEY